ncbi:bifunctional DNA primase/polymerase [uncultured Paracoccus sp.]|uniref:bifunctional DNA primase/polymerase n=1 Tax=uncultured Paracoccus sp. TaxID=189685 RepID=UPI00345704D8
MPEDSDSNRGIQVKSKTDLTDLLGEPISSKARNDTDLSELFGLDTLEASNLEVALSLAARGLAVCPVREWGDGDGWKPIAKFPERATTDPAQIRKWWGDWPQARVALITGSVAKIGGSQR